MSTLPVHDKTNGAEHHQHVGQHHTGPGHHHGGHEAFQNVSSPSFRKIGNPGPLGLCAFALTTFVLSLINCGTRGVAAPNVVLGLAFGYGGLVQLLAGMWEFAVGNTFGATALSSYGGFWISYAFIIAGGSNSYGVVAAYTEPSALNNALGFYLMGWFIFTFLMMLATLKSNISFFLIFFLLTITFMLLGIGHLVQTSEGEETMSIIKAAGVFGLLTAFAAWYNALAQLMENNNSFFVPPVGHFPWSEKMRSKHNRVSAQSGPTV